MTQRTVSHCMRLKGSCMMHRANTQITTYVKLCKTIPKISGRPLWTILLASIMLIIYNVSIFFSARDRQLYETIIFYLSLPCRYYPS